MDVSVGILILLGLVGLVAGFVDAIAGGGGLLTMPALLLTGLPTQMVLGTNKGQSVFGSGVALIRYGHSPLLDRRRARVTFLPGLAGAAVGVMLVGLVPSEALRPVVMGLLGAVAVFMIFYRPPRTSLSRQPHFGVGMAIAFLIAAYDGFFGPGTGTFLILAFVLAFGDTLDAASANAKVVNFASNLAALVMFAWNGWVVWKVALPMAVGQAVGGFAGAHVTIRKGRGLVRVAVVVISLGSIGWLAWKMWHG